MALQPHVKRHCSVASVAPSSPTKRTKVKFDKFVKWVEVFDRLPKRVNMKNHKGDLAAAEENKCSRAMARWDEVTLGSERFHDLEELRCRYAISLKVSYQRLDAWCQENGRLPSQRNAHGGDSEAARKKDYHALAWKRLNLSQSVSLNTAEKDLLERLKRQAKTDEWQANIREVERETRKRQKAAGVLGAAYGVKGAKFGAKGVASGAKGAKFGAKGAGFGAKGAASGAKDAASMGNCMCTRKPSCLSSSWLGVVGWMVARVGGSNSTYVFCVHRGFGV